MKIQVQIRNMQSKDWPGNIFHFRVKEEDADQSNNKKEQAQDFLNHSLPLQVKH